MYVLSGLGCDVFLDCLDEICGCGGSGNLNF